MITAEALFLVQWGTERKTFSPKQTADQNTAGKRFTQRAQSHTAVDVMRLTPPQGIKD
jgi:hypothetical protein